MNERKVRTVLGLLWYSYWPLLVVVALTAMALVATCQSVAMAPSCFSKVVAFLDVARWPIMGWKTKNPLMLGDSIMYIAILASMVLVFLNTVLVISAFLRGYEYDNDCGITFSAEEMEERARIRRKRSHVLWVLGLVLAGLGGWVGLSISGSVFAMGRDWWGWRSPSGQASAHEWVSLLLFFVFLIVDWRLLSAINHESRFWESWNRRSRLPVRARGAISAKLKSLNRERCFQRYSIFLVDVPVILGVSAIMVVHGYVHAHRYHVLADRSQAGLKRHLLPPDNLDLCQNDVERDSLLPVMGAAEAGLQRKGFAGPTCAEKISRERQVRRFAGFVQGLSAGGVMMHIVMSQFILGVLLFWLFSAERREGPNQRTVAPDSRPEFPLAS